MEPEGAIAQQQRTRFETTAMKDLSFLLSILFLCIYAGPAATAQKQDKPADGEAMRIRIVHSEQMGCEPKCAEWISAEGKIVLGTAEQLRKAVNSVYPRKLPILIHSSGGLTSDAILMGILIRSRRLDVGVARTVFEPCSDAPVGCKQGPWKGALGRPDSQLAACNLACTLVLAAGVRRFVAPEAQVGVHNPTVDERIVEKWRRTYKGARPMEEVIQRQIMPAIVAQIRYYLIMMGISDELLLLMDSSPPAGLRILSESELMRLGLATESQDGQALVNQSNK
jgi:hypothetical protein